MNKFSYILQGLDYPPLTAYHMLLCGKIAHYLNPSWVADGSSRGFESFYHQVFMRLTVLAGDLLLLVPAALLLKKKIGKLAYLGLLFNPCLILGKNMTTYFNLLHHS